ncbi:hypothetical protein V8E54_006326 [Elaphomyces granulatus]
MTLWSLGHKASSSFYIAFEPTNETLSVLARTTGTRSLLSAKGFPSVLDTFLPQPDANGDRFIAFEAHTSTPLPSSASLQAHIALAMGS